MSTHIYDFEGELRKQKEGGPIGLELTGDIAQIYMIWYDQELQKKLHEKGLEIKMYRRYVDDINIILKTPNQEIIDEDRINNNSNDEDITIKTMNTIREIGGTVHDSIKLQIDTPALNKDKKCQSSTLKYGAERRKLTIIQKKKT